MSRLECFPSVFNENTILLLKHNKVKTVFDFLYESPESVCKKLKLPFKDILEIREKLVVFLRTKASTALDLLKQVRSSQFIVSTGIPEIDQLIGGLESGRIYEMCGSSGSGKTQICLSIAAHASFVEKRVLFVDTKNDFSSSTVFKTLKEKYHKDGTIEMERIKVTKAFSLHKLVDVLQWLQSMYKFCHIPLVIIDCISTCYFAYVGCDKPIGYAMLNHIASLLQYIVSQCHCVVILTNLATKGFHAGDSNKAGIEKSMKPCLGSYWQQISNVRLDLKRTNNDCIVAVSVGRNDYNFNKKISHINLMSGSSKC